MLQVCCCGPGRYIDRLLQQWRANAGSATLTAYIRLECRLVWIYWYKLNSHLASWIALHLHYMMASSSAGYSAATALCSCVVIYDGGGGGAIVQRVSRPPGASIQCTIALLFVHVSDVISVRGSVSLAALRIAGCNTSGFMDGVIFAHNGAASDVSALSCAG